MQQVDRTCDGFEAAWSAAGSGSKRPQIEEYLAEAPESLRAVLLDQLLELEVAYRRQNGEKPTLGEYFLRFPDFFREMTLSEQDTGRLAAKPQTQATTSPAMWRRSQRDADLPEATPSSGQALPPARVWPKVPDYEILSELGAGGMGVVYKARHIRLRLPMAIKVIRAGQDASLEELIRFGVEARAIAALNHPHIVRIYEYGEYHGLPYFSMEYLDGGSMAQKLAGRPLPPCQAAELMETLARTLQFVHEHNIIHRDLKPGNVLLTANGTPKISDFGLAKRLDEYLTGGSITRTGVVLGTISYMAPEQASGHAKAVGPATDIYALGAMLYETLTGKPPFQGDSWLETLDKVRFEDPLPPSHLQPDVPSPLEAICLHCLQKEPGRRWVSAEALAEQLRKFLDA
jgi:serine/threonine protein kinase